jgi:hypothetical protein
LESCSKGVAWDGDCIAIPFMLRELYRTELLGRKSIIDPFALSLSKGSEGNYDRLLDEEEVTSSAVKEN